MPSGYTDSCFTDILYIDGFSRVIRTDIGDKLERERKSRWNRPQWVAIGTNSNAQANKMTAREAERWGNQTEAEYR